MIEQCVWLAATKENVATQMIALLKERIVSFDQNVFSLMT